MDLIGRPVAAVTYSTYTLYTSVDGSHWLLHWALSKCIVGQSVPSALLPASKSWEMFNFSDSDGSVGQSDHVPRTSDTPSSVQRECGLTNGKKSSQSIIWNLTNLVAPKQRHRHTAVPSFPALLKTMASTRRHLWPLIILKTDLNSTLE